jgi:lysophospholipase L1-like esterase
LKLHRAVPVFVLGAAAALVVPPAGARDRSAVPPIIGSAEGASLGPDIERPPRAAAPSRRYIVAAIGDSLTDTRVGGGRYMKHLARLCPASRFDTYGIGGQQTVDMRARFDDDVFGAGRKDPKVQYTHLIILGGVNDLYGGTVGAARIARIEAQLGAMYAAARARNVAVIALTVPPWGHAGGAHDLAVTATLNGWIVDRAKSGEIADAVDLSPLVACGKSQTLCVPYRKTYDDQVHWNDDGHAVVAAAIHRAAFADCE